MAITPYLFFSGNCAEAFHRYEEILSGTLEIMRHGDLPPGAEMAGALPEHVMHASLTLPDGAELFGSDDPTGDGGPKVGLAVTFTAPDVETGRRVFDGLAAGGKVDMEFEATFWSAGFGGVTDRFGVPWLIDTAGEP